MKFYATVPKGLAQVLADELKELGAEDVQARAAGVGFNGTLETAYRVCLWSRIASRVLMPLVKWPAANPDALYAAASEFDWAAHMTLQTSFAINCTQQRAAISHTQYAALKVKDALVDSFREQTGERPSVDTTQPDLRFHVHLKGKQAELSLDLSGDSLHRRSYRRGGHAAPIKENLAAAILRMADWPALSKQQATLIDPMCGTGTLLIEAAGMAADIAPGLSRQHFAFEAWQQHDKTIWQALLKEARQRQQQALHDLPVIYGYDSDSQAIEQARSTIKRAGLSELIKVEQASIEQLIENGFQTGSENGLLITNPPYGERLGEQQQLQQLYSQFARLLREHVPAWRAALITSSEKLACFVNLPLVHGFAVFNGPIESHVYVYTPVNKAMVDESAMSFSNRLRKNYKHLSKMAKRQNTDCYRVYDADLPEYAAAIDIYECDVRHVHIQEYAPPKSIDTDNAFVHLQQLITQTVEVLEVPASRIYLKIRQRQKGKQQYTTQAEYGKNYVVHEQGLQFWVNFTDYLDTGLFLDHRITRKRIFEQASGKHFLNLFAYTCTVSVYAAAGGAASTTSVDLSSTYLAWGEKNMSLNSLDKGKQRFIREDCMQWLRKQVKKPDRKYELIFIDPPTFSNSKRNKQDFDVQRNHVELIRLAAELLTDDGLLIFSNNFRRFKLDSRHLQPFHIRDISAATLPEDFKRNPRIHQCWEIRKS